VEKEETHTVLVVEDDSSIAELLRLYLGREGYRVLLSERGERAVGLVEEEGPALMVLDLMLPDGSGLDALKAVRKFSDIPVVILTAKDTDQDKIMGLELGADDYVTKPFSPGELMARVRAVLRRAGGAQGDKLSAGGIEMSREARVLTVEGREVDLTPREFDLLHYLMLNHGVALSRERLLEQVWDYSFYGAARTVDVHIRQLRKKLGHWNVVIRTVWGVGYKVDPSVVPEKGGEGELGADGQGRRDG